MLLQTQQLTLPVSACWLRGHDKHPCSADFHQGSKLPAHHAHKVHIGGGLEKPGHK